MIATDGGMKAIEDIQVGDRVWSKSDVTGEEGYKPVLTLFKTKPTALYHLTYRRAGRDKGSALRGARSSTEGEGDSDAEPPLVITGTVEHPFWSVTRNGWTALSELQPGERLLLADGAEAEVVGVRVETLGDTSDVAARERGHFWTYNFEVADWHTYFVAPPDHPDSRDGAWVHNMCAAARQQVRELMAANPGLKRRDAIAIVANSKTGAREGVSEAGAAASRLRFSQTTASAAFREDGTFAGETIGSLAAKIRSGAISPADITVRYVTINGNNLIVNTRSSLALRRAGIPQSSWTLIDTTLTDAADIQRRLQRNKLSSEGTDVLRITGLGSSASSLR